MGNLPDIDILIATDCISEGQNLQDCDYLINYDIHWNPVRIIQRFGRIDRIGSKNSVIQLVNFWPDITLDEYINLKSRVETRMKIVDMTATGDDNILSDEEKHDLEYRKAQLKRLQEEVVDIEEMSTGISIMDLGLNEFRMDLLEYIKQHPEVEHTPMGLHAVAPASVECPPGVIFVLKNRTQSVNVDNRNRLHPFYMVYISEDGEVICDYLQPKKLLDTMRLVCKGKDGHLLFCQPNQALTACFMKSKHLADVKCFHQVEDFGVVVGRPSKNGKQTIEFGSERTEMVRQEKRLFCQKCSKACALTRFFFKMKWETIKKRSKKQKHCSMDMEYLMDQSQFVFYQCC